MSVGQMELEKAEQLLSAYTLDELFELNDITEVEVVCFLFNHRMLKLPEVLPLEFVYETSN